jgi:hypothetical protein
MPYIDLQDPWGSCFRISTRRETTLKAWFDEILPIVNRSMGHRDTPAAMIMVHPMWGGSNGLTDADWPADTRVIGRPYPFPAKNGDDGMKELEELRTRLTVELATMEA